LAPGKEISDKFILSVDMMDLGEREVVNWIAEKLEQHSIRRVMTRAEMREKKEQEVQEPIETINNKTEPTSCCEYNRSVRI